MADLGIVQVSLSFYDSENIKAVLLSVRSKWIVYINSNYDIIIRWEYIKIKAISYSFQNVSNFVVITHPNSTRISSWNTTCYHVHVCYWQLWELSKAYTCHAKSLWKKNRIILL